MNCCLFLAIVTTIMIISGVNSVTRRVVRRRYVNRQPATSSTLSTLIVDQEPITETILMEQSQQLTHDMNGNQVPTKRKKVVRRRKQSPTTTINQQFGQQQQQQPAPNQWQMMNQGMAPQQQMNLPPGMMAQQQPMSAPNTGSKKGTKRVKIVQRRRPQPVVTSNNYEDVMVQRLEAQNAAPMSAPSEGQPPPDHLQCNCPPPTVVYRCDVPPTTTSSIGSEMYMNEQRQEHPTKSEDGPVTLEPVTEPETKSSLNPPPITTTPMTFINVPTATNNVDLMETSTVPITSPVKHIVTSSSTELTPIEDGTNSVESQDTDYEVVEDVQTEGSDGQFDPFPTESSQ